MSEAKEMVVECIHTLFSDNQTPTVEEVANAVVKGLGLEQEWAVAEYDLEGKLSHITHHDYEFKSVYRFFDQLQANLEREGVDTKGSFGLVSRTFSGWKKV